MECPKVNTKFAEHWKNLILGNQIDRLRVFFEVKNNLKIDFIGRKIQRNETKSQNMISFPNI